jgi:peptide-methionine (R)-S-oxide reductase
MRCQRIAILQNLCRRPYLSFMGASSDKEGMTTVTNCAQRGERDGSRAKNDQEWKAALSPQQYRVLRLKATDPRGLHYDNFFEDGAYHCAGCDALLYTSDMKFACGCGWPGFWDCVPKAVREEPDADGQRVEILCNFCDGHLGHVFRGEGFSNPPPNERHCVNSTSIIFRKRQ